ncbi:MAG: ABC transporter ATP-binding protein [Candidatus Heimdallarchaeota archaeon]|nr:ABC transporter ATP-binding protein [Candidatus Heimdallarchaeota archaeon]
MTSAEISEQKQSGFIRWIVGYLLDHPIMTSIVYFTALVEPFFYMIPLIISADIVDILLTTGSWDAVWSALLFLIPISLFQVFLFFLSSFLNEVLAHRVTTDVTYDLFSLMQDRSLTYHDEKDSGKTMSLAMNDTRSLNMFLNPGIRMILAFVSIYVVAGIILSLVDMMLVYILLVVMCIFTYQVILYRKKLGPISSQVLEEQADLASISSDTLGAMRDVKSYRSEMTFNKKFSRKVTKQAVTMELEGKVGTLFWPSLIVLFAAVGMTSYSIYLLYLGLVTYKSLVLVTTAMSLVYGFSTEFKWISFIMAGGFASAERLNAFVNEEDPYKMEDGFRPYEDLSATIEFRNVSFGFDVRDKNGKVTGYNQALSNISFKVNDSETIAVVGGPGSGKSSLIKLIQRLYTPDDGTILIGGHPINEFENTSLRKQMATVEQEIHLFNDTVFENIRFGRPDASREEVFRAAELAQANSFIEEFENGYDELIGDNGVRLSGGQAQRIAIARALLINPVILILDDGASALDARTEQRIQKAITEILKTRTTIITTHRLAIIANADRVLILDRGEVKGFGTHEELIHNNTYYRRFFERHYELPPLEAN